MRDLALLARRRVADALIRLAYRLDGSRPAAESRPNGGWLVSLGNVPLARVAPGQVTDTREMETDLCDPEDDGDCEATCDECGLLHWGRLSVSSASWRGSTHSFTTGHRWTLTVHPSPEGGAS